MPKTKSRARKGRKSQEASSVNAQTLESTPDTLDSQLKKKKRSELRKKKRGELRKKKIMAEWDKLETEETHSWKGKMEELDTGSEDKVCEGQDIHVQAPGRQRKAGKGLLQI